MIAAVRLSRRRTWQTSSRHRGELVRSQILSIPDSSRITGAEDQSRLVPARWRSANLNPGRHGVPAVALAKGKVARERRTGANSGADLAPLLHALQNDRCESGKPHVKRSGAIH